MGSSGPCFWNIGRVLGAVFLFRPASGYFQTAEAAGAEPVSVEVRRSALTAEERRVVAEPLSSVPAEPARALAVGPGAPFAEIEERVADTAQVVPGNAAAAQAANTAPDAPQAVAGEPIVDSEPAVPGDAAEAQAANTALAFPRSEAADLAPHWARAARLAAVAELVAGRAPVSLADAAVAQAESCAPDATRAAGSFVGPVRPEACCPAQESERPAAGLTGSAQAVRLAPAALSPAYQAQAPAPEPARDAPVVAPGSAPDESAPEAVPDAPVAAVARDEERSASPGAHSASSSR